MNRILGLFSQPSTYAGLSGLSAAVGLSVPQFEAVATAAAAVCGVLAVFIDERGARPSLR